MDFLYWTTDGRRTGNSGCDRPGHHKDSLQKWKLQRSNRDDNRYFSWDLK
jgi:hypothetical protein